MARKRHDEAIGPGRVGKVPRFPVGILWEREKFPGRIDKDTERIYADTINPLCKKKNFLGSEPWGTGKLTGREILGSGP